MSHHYLLTLFFACELLWARGIADEEDPLQHVAQIAARERHLIKILNLLDLPTSSTDTHPADHKAPGGCNHEVLDFTIRSDQLKRFSEGRRAALQLCNLLNNLYLANTATDSVAIYPPHIFYALVRAFLEAEETLVSLGVAFLRGEFNSQSDDNEHSTPYYRELFGAYGFFQAGSIHVTDLTLLYNHSYDHSDQEGTQWFTQIAHRSTLRRINNTESTSPLTVTKKEDGQWVAKPFLDCGASGEWVIAHSLPFYGRANDGVSARLKGVVLATFPLQKIDINQCDDSEDLLEHHTFGGTHKCDTSSTACVPIAGLGFTRGGYRCQCHPTHYLPNSTEQYFEGVDIESAISLKKDTETFKCEPCPLGCSKCSGSMVCSVQYDAMTRLIPVCVQGVAVLFCSILCFRIFKLRKCKVIAASLWTMLEVMLTGAIFLYTTVFFRYMEPSLAICLFEPWMREVGFTLFYGAIVLKLYRSLVDYRTRKAHRYVIRDRDLLKYLGSLIIFIFAYMTAWTAVAGQLTAEGHSLVTLGRTNNGLTFLVCRSFWWEYVTEVGEILFILFGVYLWWQLKSAAAGAGDVEEIAERRGMATSLLLEFASSSFLYVTRHILWLEVHPDHVFLAYFFRIHVTVSVSLILILLPKFWCTGFRPPSRADVGRRTVSTAEGADLRFSVDPIANGDLDAIDINLSQMDPEEIKSELKRVYTQLEVLKTKTMRKDNPHISKRRGGRKPTHRRFSLQSRKGSRDKSVHRQHTKGFNHPLDIMESEVNRTPEESVCSVEGPSVLSVYADGPSTYSETGTPSILHRSYKT